MARVKLTRDTAVRYPAGAELEVSQAEASRLQAFGLAVVIAEEEKPKKKAAKKAAK